MNKKSRLRVKYYSYKVEFALRGAAHIHGVLWMDWENFSEIEVEDKKKVNVKSLVSALDKIRDEIPLDEPDKAALVKFADMSITCSNKDHRTKDIVNDVQTHHHTSACRKYQTNCRFSFPRFPCLRTLVSVPYTKIKGTKEEQKKKLEESKKLLKRFLKFWRMKTY